MSDFFTRDRVGETVILRFKGWFSSVNMQLQVDDRRIKLYNLSIL